VCVGAGIGLNAAIISIITEWLSDIKMGYCSDGWWLNQQFCCWELDGDEDSGCDSWHLWSTVSVARWFIYVLFAVRHYLSPSSLPTLPHALGEYGLTKSTKKVALSFVAARLVQSLARHAAGSGISEIKCIISGFVMEEFLGFWTFLIKSLTLVSENETNFWCHSVSIF
jgi:chloride channel 3/4/5